MTTQPQDWNLQMGMFDLTVSLEDAFGSTLCGPLLAVHKLEVSVYFNDETCSLKGTNGTTQRVSSASGQAFFPDLKFQGTAWECDGNGDQHSRQLVDLTTVFFIPSHTLCHTYSFCQYTLCFLPIINSFCPLSLHALSVCLVPFPAVFLVTTVFSLLVLPSCRPYRFTARFCSKKRCYLHFVDQCYYSWRDGFPRSPSTEH